jgi:hypothetical protein
MVVASDDPPAIASAFRGAESGFAGATAGIKMFSHGIGATATEAFFSGDGSALAAAAPRGASMVCAIASAGLVSTFVEAF